MSTFDLGVVWHRRDLRIADHPALYAASQECRHLLAVHIVSNAELEPRTNQTGAHTGAPRMGPHQLRCAPCVRFGANLLRIAPAQACGALSRVALAETEQPKP